MGAVNWLIHYKVVTRALLHLASPATRLFVQHFRLTKASELSINGPLKRFHVITSSNAITYAPPDFVRCSYAEVIVLRPRLQICPLFSFKVASLNNGFEYDFVELPMGYKLINQIRGPRAVSYGHFGTSRYLWYGWIVIPLMVFCEVITCACAFYTYLLLIPKFLYINCDQTLQWRHNGQDSVSNHPPHDCLLNRLFRRRWKKTSKLRVTGLCAGNSPVTIYGCKCASLGLKELNTI